jgi:tRNA pseudouridine38-40 synthase
MRYFIEVSYKGTNYSGFQVQANANSVQAEVEKALGIFYREVFSCTGSSRTDAGVHALQNYFHVDTGLNLEAKHVYNINSILPEDIVIKGFHRVGDEVHCRFDAIWREYEYFIFREKDPFLDDRAYYYPYALDGDLMTAAAEAIKSYEDFSAFSKRNTQVKSFRCRIIESSWVFEEGCWKYGVRANRFLRGMVRGLVGTMLQVGRGKLSVEEFKAVIESGDSLRVDFSVPGRGLFLKQVAFPNEVLDIGY